jgi:hypothetical protein
VFVLCLVIVRDSDHSLLGSFGHHRDNRANPRPSYAEDEPRRGEKEFEQNDLRETGMSYAQKNVLFKAECKTILGNDDRPPFGWEKLLDKLPDSARDSGKQCSIGFRPLPTGQRVAREQR